MSPQQNQGSASSHSLQGMTVVVTRPHEQAGALCDLLERAGATAIRFPVIQISPRDDFHTNAVRQQLEQSDMLIFISANAVRYGADLLKQVQQPHWQVVAIGRATAKTLQQLGVQVDIIPEHDFSTEALLAMPSMQDVAGKRVTLIKGEGGRELLSNTLVGRGALVDDLPVYRRTLPIVNVDAVLPVWSRGDIDAVVITSQEGLANLFSLLGDEGKNYLQHTPMVVVSERIKQACLQYRVAAPVVVATQASNEAIVAALIKLFSKTSSGADDE